MYEIIFHSVALKKVTSLENHSYFSNKKMSFNLKIKKVLSVVLITSLTWISLISVGDNRIFNPAKSAYSMFPLLYKTQIYTVNCQVIPPLQMNLPVRWPISIAQSELIIQAWPLTNGASATANGRPSVVMFSSNEPQSTISPMPT